VSGDVLERNVRALLRRSYVPALPTPVFRDRLESLLLAEVARRTAVRPAPRRLRRVTVAVLAMAAATVLVFLGARVLRHDGEARTPRTALLARGEVALGDADGSWRAASPEEVEHGLLYAAALLEVETPAGRTLPVRIGAGVLRVAEDTALTLRGPAVAARAELHRGGAAWQIDETELALEVGVPFALLTPGETAGPIADTETRVPAPLEATPEAPPEAPGGEPVPVPLARGLSGRVLEASSGDPVTHFTVGLLRKAVDFSPTVPLTRTFDSPDGTFAWPDAPVGEQRVFVHAPDFVLAQLGPHVLPRDSALDVQLVPGWELEGSVLDPAGNPVQGALVIPESEVPCDMLTLRDTEQAFWVPVAGHTGAQGRFTLRHLPTGPQTLRVTADGWAPAWVRVEVGASEAAPETVVRLQEGGAIAGRVTGADGGPRAGALLITMPMDASQGQRRAHFDMATSDSDGRYAFEHVPLGSMIVVLTGTDAPPEVKPVRILEGEAQVVDFAAPRGGVQLRGVLTDSQGAPIGLQNMALIDVETLPETRWDQQWVATTTDPDGGYRFDGVAPGNYQFFLVTDRGRGLRLVDEIQLPDEPEVVHEVRVPPGRLDVRVVDRTGKPEAGALLFLGRRADQGWTFAGHCRTDDRGLGEFAGLRAGTYTIEACPSRDGPGHVQSDDVLLTTTAATRELTLELSEGGVVTGRLVDEHGTPVTSARVGFRDAAGVNHPGSLMPYTDEAGAFEAFGLPPGEYTASVHAPDGRTIERDFVKSPGIDPDLHLTLPPLSEENER
jgi:hypothetical protein